MAVSTKAVQRREKSGLGERLFAPQMAEVLTEYPIALTLASCCMMTLVFAYRHWLALQQLTEKYTTAQQAFPNHNRHLLAKNTGALLGGGAQRLGTQAYWAGLCAARVSLCFLALI